MAIVKGSGQNFSKKPTNIGIPVVTQPRELITALALVGCQDIDENTPEVLYFHVFGGVPGDIRLFLYGEEFSPIHYSELPEHDHGPGSYQTGNVNAGSTSHAHGHTFSINNTNLAHIHSWSTTGGSHTHNLIISENSTAGDDGVDTNNEGVTSIDSRFVQSSSHSHSGNTGSSLGNHGHGLSGGISSNSVDSHQHGVTGGLSSTKGLTGSAALNTSSVKDYFDDLQISVDGVDRTATLKGQAGVAKFGDGTSGDGIVTSGVELQLAPFISTPGQHKVTFSLGGSQNGGKLRYNLYLLA